MMKCLKNKEKSHKLPHNLKSDRGHKLLKKAINASHLMSRNLKSDNSHKLLRNLKSQMEIMGLVIVVILVSIAMLFVIRFVILEQPSEYKSEYVNMEIASNLVGAILKTTNPDCYHRTFRELLQDCAENTDNPSITCPNGENSCVFVHNRLNESDGTGILQKTLDVWKTKYHLRAVMEGSSMPIADIEFKDYNNGCNSGYTTKDAKTFPIPIGTTGGANLNVELYICR